MYRKYGYLTTGGEVVVPVIMLNDKSEVMVPIEYDNIGEFNEDGFAVASTAFIGFATDIRKLYPRGSCCKCRTAHKHWCSADPIRN